MSASSEPSASSPDDQPAPPAAARRRWLRIAIPVLATVAIVAPLGYLWQQSLVPSSYSVMEMGTVDYGGGPWSMSGHSADGGHHGGMGPTTSVTDLVADPKRRPDVKYELVTRTADLAIGGRLVSGFTVNGTSPGPTLTLTQGQLVQITVRNESVSEGVSMHWHGLNVPNAMDGVAGVTQDAIAPGASFVYRFVAGQVGTYWYHSHQVSHTQVLGGLLGVIVVRAAKAPGPTGREVTAVAHTYGGIRTINGRPADLEAEAGPDERVRLRVVNTDNAPMEVWASAAYRLLAVDGNEVNRPTPVEGRSTTVTAGGRADLEVTVPADGAGVRVQLSRATAIVVGRRGVSVPVPAQPAEDLDLLTYGTKQATGLDPSRAVRHFDYDVGRIPGFVRGRPGLWWSINGRLYPHIPMYVVREGEIVVMRIHNGSGEVHPMHLHGHTALVLSRNGIAATGSPWWVDSLNVLDSETYEIAFSADNPGIWMDHCHNLEHAAEGMVAHLMYEGVDTPFRVGGSGSNQPE